MNITFGIQMSSGGLIDYIRARILKLYDAVALSQ